ncbi:hypothetical protein B0G84_1219 [Paraburkholderia sp. BL8N3]|nr:hypothetical protein [Paraburkholderia sp. BL8N3]TCK42910.1 hypothetical protein B0G84_1219 [Paraburkholderia sp. BL8N3]
MRISARTFGQLVSNSTLVFANTGLALALFPFGAEANAAMAGGAGGIAGESSEAGMELKRPLHHGGEDSSRPAFGCALADAATSPDKSATPAIARVTHRNNSVTLWDEITPPAPPPVPVPAPVPEPLPVPVEAIPDASGAAKTCASG